MLNHWVCQGLRQKKCIPWLRKVVFWSGQFWAWAPASYCTRMGPGWLCAVPCAFSLGPLGAPWFLTARHSCMGLEMRELCKNSTNAQTCCGQQGDLGMLYYCVSLKRKDRSSAVLHVGRGQSSFRATLRTRLVCSHPAGIWSLNLCHSHYVPPSWAAGLHFLAFKIYAAWLKIDVCF